MDLVYHHRIKCMKGRQGKNGNIFKRFLCPFIDERMVFLSAVEFCSSSLEFRTDCIACASSSKILKTWLRSPFCHIKLTKIKSIIHASKSSKNIKTVVEKITKTRA
ncbi:uncharacterized protein DS421_1g18900 [Arachis hypogaea]|nr:uncharacterized protein DS421_1g18900 [Arachis hypogaea]